MKIAAKIDDDRILVEMTRDELAYIMGHYSKYTNIKVHDSKNSPETQVYHMAVGTEVDVSKTYHELRRLRELPKQMADTVKMLAAAQATIETIQSIYPLAPEQQQTSEA